MAWRLAQWAHWLLPFAVLGGLPLFFVTGFSLTGSAFFGAVSSLGHTLFFAALTISLLPQIRRFWPYRWRSVSGYWVGLSLVGLIFSLVIESIQHWVGRQFSWGDIGLNLFGIWLVLLWWPHSRLSAPAGRLLQGLALAGLVFASWQAVDTYYDRTRLQNQLPLVFDQSHDRAIDYWEGDVAWLTDWPSAPEDAPNHDMALLQLGFSVAHFSSVMLIRLPHDWSDYDRLSFRLYNPQSTSLALRLRLNDHAHEISSQDHDDRFNVSLAVQPGWQTFEIALIDVATAPVERTMDLSTMRRFGLFTTQLSEPAVIYLDQLQLIREQ